MYPLSCMLFEMCLREHLGHMDDYDVVGLFSVCPSSFLVEFVRRGSFFEV